MSTSSIGGDTHRAGSSVSITAPALRALAAEAPEGLVDAVLAAWGCTTTERFVTVASPAGRPLRGLQRRRHQRRDARRRCSTATPTGSPRSTGARPDGRSVARDHTAARPGGPRCAAARRPACATTWRG